MKVPYIYVLLLYLTSCSSEQSDEHLKSLENQVRQLTQQITNAEVIDNLPSVIQHYEREAISMPEYQLTLTGRDEIEAFYSEIFRRQNVKSFSREIHEFIHLDETIVEIGTFKKEYIHTDDDSLISLSGKYWHVWAVDPDGHHKLKGEAFGYFHPVAHPEAMTVPLNKLQPDENEILAQKEIPFELKAYNALMEKGVRNRDGILRSEFFTEDASFFPFADTTVTGMKELKPYLIEYSNRGTVTIDSIMCYTYAFESMNEYVLEYAMFKVKWTRPDVSGRTEGKGIRIWKRQADHSLRLYRQIGMHNHL